MEEKYTLGLFGLLALLAFLAFISYLIWKTQSTPTITTADIERAREIVRRVEALG